MASRTRPGRFVPAVLVIGAAFLLVPGRVKAQFGFGGGFGGFGYGGFGFRPVPTPESYLYSNALVAASRPVSALLRDSYANNPNSYINHVRDNGFVDRYSRRSAGNPAIPGCSAAASGGAPALPNLPLLSFYNANSKLEWPANARRTDGELKQKRDVSTRRASKYWRKRSKNGVAALASVTNARQKLLDYGRPALVHVRAHETPRVADTFHMFMLSLYESLAQAANPAPRRAGSRAAGQL